MPDASRVLKRPRRSSRLLERACRGLTQRRPPSRPIRTWHIRRWTRSHCLGSAPGHRSNVSSGSPVRRDPPTARRARRRERLPAPTGPGSGSRAASRVVLGLASWHDVLARSPYATDQQVLGGPRGGPPRCPGRASGTRPRRLLGRVRRHRSRRGAELGPATQCVARRAGTGLDRDVVTHPRPRPRRAPASNDHGPVTRNNHQSTCPCSRSPRLRTTTDRRAGIVECSGRSPLDGDQTTAGQGAARHTPINRKVVHRVSCSARLHDPYCPPCLNGERIWHQEISWIRSDMRSPRG
jgi:hypothetical protein